MKKVIYVEPELFQELENDTKIQCPYCGHVETLENYDCLGADEGCVFCNHCVSEVRL